MNDHDLKSLLQETCPVLPGQEARAWKLLQEQMRHPVRHSSWLSWRSLTSYGAGLAVVLFFAVRVGTPQVAQVSASSQAPGIFATAFYSQPAHAQVVWLNGIGSTSDTPTAMDRTGPIDERVNPKPQDSP